MSPAKTKVPKTTAKAPSGAPKTFNEILLRLQQFWAAQGCVLLQPYDVEKGAGTFNPATFLRVLGPEPWRVGYVEPSRRPRDGRYGDNPNRLYQHTQYQVILKPSPDDVQDLYLGSLRAIGITPEEHDLRFQEDDWESPTIGAWGLGWQVVVDGMEVTQFTYFQQMAGIDLRPISVELTYGMERLAMMILGADSVYDIPMGGGFTYRQIFHRNEVEFSKYSFEVADVQALRLEFERYENECGKLVGLNLVLPAYDAMLKCCHNFNVMEARGSLSVAERTAFLGRVRKLARLIAEGYLREVPSPEGRGEPFDLAQGPEPVPTSSGRVEGGEGR